MFGMKAARPKVLPNDTWTIPELQLLPCTWNCKQTSLQLPPAFESSDLRILQDSIIHAKTTNKPVKRDRHAAYYSQKNHLTFSKSLYTQTGSLPSRRSNCPSTMAAAAARGTPSCGRAPRSCSRCGAPCRRPGLGPARRRLGPRRDGRREGHGRTSARTGWFGL